MDTNSTAAKEHPTIKEFVNLVDKTVGDDVLDFAHLREKPFMKFWSNFILYQYEEDNNDFRIKFHGTYITTNYGEDWTGKLLSKVDLGDEYNNAFNQNLQIIKSEHRVYASGTFFWKNREHKKFYHVKMPLRRNDKINEVLLCADIE